MPPHLAKDKLCSTYYEPKSRLHAWAPAERRLVQRLFASSSVMCPIWDEGPRKLVPVPARFRYRIFFHRVAATSVTRSESYFRYHNPIIPHTFVGPLLWSDPGSDHLWSFPGTGGFVLGVWTGCGWRFWMCPPLVHPTSPMSRCHGVSGVLLSRFFLGACLRLWALIHRTSPFAFLGLMLLSNSSSRCILL